MVQGESESRGEKNKLSELYTAFENGDTESITKYLNRQLIYTVSYYDSRESFYHGFLLALLSTCADWRVSSNIEAEEAAAMSSWNEGTERSALL